MFCCGSAQHTPQMHAYIRIHLIRTNAEQLRCVGALANASKMTAEASSLKYCVVYGCQIVSVLRNFVCKIVIIVF